MYLGKPQIIFLLLKKFLIAISSFLICLWVAELCCVVLLLYMLTVEAVIVCGRTQLEPPRWLSHRAGSWGSLLARRSAGPFTCCASVLFCMAWASQNMVTYLHAPGNRSCQPLRPCAQKSQNATSAACYWP